MTGLQWEGKQWLEWLKINEFPRKHSKKWPAHQPKLPRMLCVSSPIQKPLPTKANAQGKQIWSRQPNASLMAAGQVEAVKFWINHIILIQIALHFMNHKKLWSSNFEIYNLITRFSTRQNLSGGWFALLCLFWGGGGFRCWGQYLHFHQHHA